MISRNDETGVVCKCKCGVEFVPKDNTSLMLCEPGTDIHKALYEAFDAMLCENCEEKRRKEEKIREYHRHLQIRLREMPQVAAEAGIPPRFRDMTEPFVRWTASFLWQHRKEHLLLSGDTGVGKTSGSCLCALNMLKMLKRVRYTSRAKLTAELVAVKTGKGDAEAFYRKLYYSHDLLIIDEVVGKDKVTDTTKELMARLVDDCYSGECRAKVWLLGNFYEGSIDTLVEDVEPFKRKIFETFNPCVCDVPNRRIIPLEN